jgi:hypothetical protein
VPHALVGTVVELRVTAATMDCGSKAAMTIPFVEL